MEMPVSNKYAPLCRYLQALSPDTQEDTLGFADIERLLGQPLPSSALKYSPWWANQANVGNRPQAKAWTSAGFDSSGLPRPQLSKKPARSGRLASSGQPLSKPGQILKLP